jgi:hypothetical protein
MSDVEDRKAALEFALKEIAAYKEAVLADGHTERLIASAIAINEYIQKGPIQTQ